MARVVKNASRKNNKSRTSSRRLGFRNKVYLRSSRAWIFALAFAVVGTVLVYRSFAASNLPSYSDDIVAGYINMTPTSIVRDSAGNLSYEMYPASTYVQVDGTLVCDQGASNGSTVTTGALTKREVGKLHKDLNSSGALSLPDEVSAGDKSAVVEFEGIVIGGAESAKGTAIYPGAKKPAAFTEAQEMIQALCAKANSTVERSTIKTPKEPKLKSTKKSAVTFVDNLFTAKASACCNTGTRDTAFETTHASAINTYRANNSRTQLPRIACLDKTALNWTHKMTNAGAISHNPNLGSDVTNNCYVYWTKLGENVGVGYDSSGLMDAFINSPSHNANLLDKDWKYMGIGGVKHPDGRLFVTQNYAKW